MQIEATGREAYHPSGKKARKIMMRDLLRGEAFAGPDMMKLIGWQKGKRKRSNNRKVFGDVMM
jgi:hypothetical protein